jgi:hypothetical protein
VEGVIALSTSHDVIRWLDDFRHFLAYAFAPNNWITNGSEQVIAIAVGAVITYLVWPRLHNAVNNWVKRHLKAENEELHRKLDHIIDNSKDIPPLPPK